MRIAYCLTRLVEIPRAETALYKWIDETVAIHCSNSPFKIPERFRNRVREFGSGQAHGFTLSPSPRPISLLEN